MKKADNIMELIGKTPVVKLNKLVNEEMADIYVKLEYFNPGGSIKDRIALAMIEKAEEEGLLKLSLPAEILELGFRWWQRQKDIK